MDQAPSQLDSFCPESRSAGSREVFALDSKGGPDRVDVGAISSVVTVRFGGIGYVPVLIVKGDVAVDFLDWIAGMKADGGWSASTLYHYAVSVCFFCNFMDFHSSRKIATPIVRAFFKTRIHGNPDLGWKHVAVETAKQNVIALEKFIDWFSEKHGLQNPNPKVSHPVSWGSVVWEAARRQKTDLLAHLFFTTKRSRTQEIRRRVVWRREERGKQAKPSRPKDFRFEDFVVLIRHERNPRNRMAWLLLGAGGIRVCELLNLLVTDFSCMVKSGECDVLLTDPNTGGVMDPRSGLSMTRQQFLRLNFNTVPREELPFGSARFAGWKGMRYQEGQTAGVTWFLPYYGRLAWKTHLQYLALRGPLCDNKHPWYLVNVKDNIGEPLTDGNLEQVFNHTCHRLGFNPPHNLHSLRHMYVTFLVETLKLPKEQAQTLVRQKSSESTDAYVHIRSEVARRTLELMATRHPIVVNFPEFLIED